MLATWAFHLIVSRGIWLQCAMVHVAEHSPNLYRLVVRKDKALLILSPFLVFAVPITATVLNSSLIYWIPLISWRPSHVWPTYTPGTFIGCAEPLPYKPGIITAKCTALKLTGSTVYEALFKQTNKVDAVIQGGIKNRKRKITINKACESSLCVQG